MEWRQMGDGRERTDHTLGFIIIRAVGSPAGTPLFCPVCRLPMLSASDSQAHRQYSCCESCIMRWAEARREQWHGGWRPTAEEIDAEVVRRCLRRPAIHL